MDESISKPLSRTQSLRKPIRPLVDIDEEADEQRRDSSGRKRVDVVQCLLDSSSDDVDDLDDVNIDIKQTSNILWLTFNEICHIRYVLAQTNLSLLMFNDNKQYLKIHNGRLCYLCRKKINEFFFLPSFLRFTYHEVCFICCQAICDKCSYSNFIPPSLKSTYPVRIRTLIKPSSTSIENVKKKTNESNPQTRTVCYDCLQVFNELTKAPPAPIKSPISPLRRTFSLPPTPSHNSNETRYTRHRRRPVQITNSKFEKTTITTTSVITEI